MKDTHKQLQEVAIGWLYGVGCSIFTKEIPTGNGIADALGVRTRDGRDDVYYIECKASRSDLICLKQKNVYRTAVGEIGESCYYHRWNKGQYINDPERPRATCEQCQEHDRALGDTGIDFYYIVVADGVKVEPTLYPLFGVIDQRGKILRKAKRMKRRDRDTRTLIVAVAHVLVYKVHGKLYGR